MSKTTVEPLCKVEELAPGEARRFDVGGLGIALVRVGDEFHALGDRCTHQDISLSEGEVDVDDCTVECWKHGSVFSLLTGEPNALPATRPTPVFEVQVADGTVSVVVPA